MGVENHRLEMLFLASSVRGHGLGRQLMQYGDEHYGITELTVNEQNPQAVAFYGTWVLPSTSALTTTRKVTPTHCCT